MEHFEWSVVFRKAAAYAECFGLAILTISFVQLSRIQCKSFAVIIQ